MKLKGLNECDIVNYKKVSMFIIFPNCSFKCDKECGESVCQNSALAVSRNVETPIEEIIKRYVNNPMISALVCGGLEPCDSWEELKELIHTLRKYKEDDIVIYTGYYKNEIEDKIKWLKQYPNIIVKFGRYIPNRPSRYDDVLGITLASDNQYAERIS